MNETKSELPALFEAIRMREVSPVREALQRGANPRLQYHGSTALHLAASVSTLEIVETLIAGGALEWLSDARGLTALEVAGQSDLAERDAIVALLDRSTIRDARFAEAVAALHAGDVAKLARLIDANPRIVHDRIEGPEVYRRRPGPDYFRDPKLFWFIANNPKRVERLPANIVEVAMLMIERGVEQADLDYALELVMTSGSAREQRVQVPLIRALLAAGAEVKRGAVLSAAAHREFEALRTVVELGYPEDALILAASGDAARLRVALQNAERRDIQDAFGLAVISARIEAVRVAIEAGASVDEALPVHAHSTALHQAALDDRVELIEYLIEAGAALDRTDELWDATPLEWARFNGSTAAVTALSARS